MSTKKMTFLMAVLTAVVLWSVSAAFAHTLDVILKDKDGFAVSASTPYSPKNTCGGCHFNCSDGSYSTDRSTWCNGTTGKVQKDCTIAGNCPDYESMATTTVSKQQGFANSISKVAFATYDVAVPLHGASTGKHSTQGRNEELTPAQRSIWGAPATISSPGMSGRY